MNKKIRNISIRVFLFSYCSSGTWYMEYRSNFTSQYGDFYNRCYK
jgi:hypothetical protein